MSQKSQELFVTLFIAILSFISSFVVLQVNKDLKNDTVSLKANERILSTQKEPIDKIVTKYRQSYTDPNQVIPGRVMETLDSLYRQSIMLAISIDKVRSQELVSEKALSWGRIIESILFFIGAALMIIAIHKYYIVKQ